MQITEEAKSFFVEQMNLNDSKNIKIYMAGMGCCSPQIGLSLEEASANDEIMEVNGIKVAVEQQVKSYVTDLVFDLQQNEDGKGIVINNASASC